MVSRMNTFASDSYYGLFPLKLVELLSFAQLPLYLCAPALRPVFIHLPGVFMYSRLMWDVAPLCLILIRSDGSNFRVGQVTWHELTASLSLSLSVDTRLPFQAEMFIQNVILVFFCLAVISCVFPWFLAAVGPLVVLFAVLHGVSRVFVRELKRLDNVTLSPFVSHITSSIQGLATLQAYGRGRDFLHRCGTGKPSEAQADYTGETQFDRNHQTS